MNPCWCLLQELAARAADMGIVYSIEVVNRYETNIANTGAMVSRPQVLALCCRMSGEQPSPPLFMPRQLLSVST